MNIQLSVVATVMLAFPVLAQTSPAPLSTSASSPVTREVLQAEQARDDAAIQRQHDQIDSLTRQMQDLKPQFDSQRQQLGDDATISDQLSDRASQASKQKYGVRVRR